jgi:hypothetical protein
LLPELQVIADWEKDGQTDVYLAPEIGQLLGKDTTTVYVTPGVGLTSGGAVAHSLLVDHRQRTKSATGPTGVTASLEVSCCKTPEVCRKTTHNDVVRARAC